jgi:fumarate hydratase class II
VIGYDRAAQIARQAHAEGRSVRDVAAATTDLSPAVLERLLDPRRLIEGGVGAASTLPERDRHR